MSLPASKYLGMELFCAPCIKKPVYTGLDQITPYQQNEEAFRLVLRTACSKPTYI